MENMENHSEMILASGNKSDMSVSVKIHNLFKLGIYNSASVSFIGKKLPGIQDFVSW